MSHTCKCGGVIKTHPLTDSREAWSCKSCGRYEVMEPHPAPTEIDRRKAANAELAAALASMVANFDYDGGIAREVRAIERANAALAKHKGATA